MVMQKTCFGPLGPKLPPVSGYAGFAVLSQRLLGEPLPNAGGAFMLKCLPWQTLRNNPENCAKRQRQPKSFSGAISAASGFVG